MRCPTMNLLQRWDCRLCPCEGQAAKEEGHSFDMYVGCSVYPGGIWIGAFPPYFSEQNVVGVAFFFCFCSRCSSASFRLSSIPLSVSLEARKRWFNTSPRLRLDYDDRITKQSPARVMRDRFYPIIITTTTTTSWQAGFEVKESQRWKQTCVDLSCSKEGTICLSWGTMHVGVGWLHNRNWKGKGKS